MSTPTTTLPPFCDLDRYLASQPDDYVPPDNLQQLLDDASAAIRRFCGWHIAPVITQDLRLDGSGSVSQRLPTLALLDVTACSNDECDLDVTELEWSADGYMRQGRSGFGWYGYGPHYAHGWTHRLRGVAVTIVHGFDLDEVGQLGALAQSVVTRAIAAPHGYVTQEQVGGTTIAYGRMTVDDRPGSMTFLGYEQELLTSYKLPGRRAA